MAEPEHERLWVRRATPDDAPACRGIRHRVFVVEQRVPEEIEFDGEDERCAQFVAGVGASVLGTARLRIVDGHAKAERVAVASDRRRGGIGRALMQALEREALLGGHDVVVLNAQVAVIPFYERLGYRAEGPRFDEAGIAHRRMTKRLNPPSR